MDLVRETMDACAAKGYSFLAPRTPHAPTWVFRRDVGFRKLAVRCAAGDADAMDEMALRFYEQAAALPGEAFLPLAGNLWRVRAYRYGSERAGALLAEWIRAHPEERMPAAYLSERLSGRAPGEALLALGFLLFTPGREYHLSAGADGVVEVYAYAGEDGPDSDGFGRETFYDWWYLDDRLNLPQGSRCLEGYSHLDRRNCAERFAAERARARGAVLRT